MIGFTKVVYLSTLWIVLSLSCALLWISFPELWPYVPLPSWNWTDRLLRSADPDDVAGLQFLISFAICASVMAAGFVTIALIRLKCRLNSGLTETREI